MENTVLELSEQLRGKSISAVELAQDYLGRIEKSDLNAYITIDKDGALEQARSADELIKEGKAQPLTGIPFGVKDAIMTKGVRTTSASKILDDFIAPYDATVIERLRSQGAIIIGKNNMDEFAMGSSTENSAYGPTLNPHDKSRVPGGSSGGSAAAVADDLCAVSLGSDTGGSIRQPASFCGVVGYKPTYGRVSRYGLIAMASSLDQIGPISKTVIDAKMVFDAIKGHDSLDDTSYSVGNSASAVKPKIGIVRKNIDNSGVEVGVRDTVKKAVDKIIRAGYEIIDIDLPNLDKALAVYYIVMPIEVSSNLARFDGVKYGKSTIKDGDVSSLIDVYINSRSQYLGGEAKRRIILGAYASSAGYIDKYYKKAQSARQLIIKDFASAFEKVDFIIDPTTPTTAFKIGEKSADPMQMYLSDIYTVPANIAGLPSVSIPCGFSDNLPVGLQITGNVNSDEGVLDFAEKIEKLFPE